MKLNKIHKLLLLLSLLGCLALIYVNYINVNHDSIHAYNSSLSIQTPDESTDTQSQDTDSELKIDINKANVGDIAKLNGVGPVIAGRIVEYRERIGKFQIIEQLLDVKGIGEKLFYKIKPYVYIGD